MKNLLMIGYKFLLSPQEIIIEPGKWSVRSRHPSTISLQKAQDRHGSPLKGRQKSPPLKEDLGGCLENSKFFRKTNHVKKSDDKLILIYDAISTRMKQVWKKDEQIFLS